MVVCLSVMVLFLCVVCVNSVVGGLRLVLCGLWISFL